MPIENISQDKDTVDTKSSVDRPVVNSTIAFDKSFPPIEIPRRELRVLISCKKGR